MPSFPVFQYLLGFAQCPDDSVHPLGWASLPPHEAWLSVSAQSHLLFLSPTSPQGTKGEIVSVVMN